MATSITEERDKAERLRSQIQRFRREQQTTIRRASAGIAISAGGAAAGVLRATLPKIPGTEIPTEALLGGAIGIAGFLGWFGDWSDEAVAFGGGMAAVSAADFTEELFT